MYIFSVKEGGALTTSLIRTVRELLELLGGEPPSYSKGHAYKTSLPIYCQLTCASTVMVYIGLVLWFKESDTCITPLIAPIEKGPGSYVTIIL